MSLLDYEKAFAKLNPNRNRGNASPHKIAMLMAVMDLVEKGFITENKIFYTEKLKEAFTEQFNKLKTENDRDNSFLPFFHLRSEGFWHHQIKPGKKTEYDKLTTASGSGAIEQHIAFAYLDDELFELIGNHVVRELLKVALFQNFEITKEKRQILLDVGNGWDWLECEACVQDYFAMLLKEFSGEKYNKAEHRRNLIEKLGKSRNKGAIEFKHQNISAILVEQGYPYISGYKPAFNYQQQLKEVVFAYLAAHQDYFDSFSNTNVQEVRQTNWDDVLDNELPEKVPAISESKREYLARKSNFSQQEASNRKLGQRGEQFVIDFERYRLEKLGRSDLAKEVEWSSNLRGDGLGYDVRSFIVEDNQVKDQELFIEVKTTASGKYQPFFISDNEVAFSKEFSKQYQLYRVFNFKDEARLFRLNGAIDQHVNLYPKTYRASFK